MITEFSHFWVDYPFKVCPSDWLKIQTHKKCAMITSHQSSRLTLQTLMTNFVFLLLKVMVSSIYVQLDALRAILCCFFIMCPCHIQYFSQATESAFLFAQFCMLMLNIFLLVIV